MKWRQMTKGAKSVGSRPLFGYMREVFDTSLIIVYNGKEIHLGVILDEGIIEL